MAVAKGERSGTELGIGHGEWGGPVSQPVRVVLDYLSLRQSQQTLERTDSQVVGILLEVHTHQSRLVSPAGPVR